MAKEQPNVGDLLHLLETSDLHELEEVRAAINEHLNADRGSIFLNSLVDYYLETNSGQALHILSSVREPHDKHLLDKLNDCMTKSACRLATLTLLEHVIRKQPPWIHKVSRAPILQALLKCLKTDTNIVVLITGVLVLIILLPMIPQPGKQNLYEFFDIFGRLASWNLKTPGNTPEVYLIHLHVSVYALFHRLYGMYPCNFVSYLRSHYSMKENMETFEEIVKPMLEHVRIHPELVTGTKDHELDPTRWKRFEIHDIVIECAKVSLDPKEASCEEGYSSIPEHFTTHLQHRQTDITDPHSCYTSASSTPFTTPRQTMAQPSCRSPQTLRCSNDPNRDVFWSPSTVCGMSTPPSSRGISPTNVASELSHSAPNQPCRLHNTPVGNKGTISNTPTTSSPPHFCSDEYVNISVQPQTITPTHKDMRPGTGHDYDGASSVVIGGSGDAIESKTTMTLDDLPQFIKELEQQDQKEREDDAIREELHNITEGKSESPGPRGGFDSPFYRTTETLTDGERKHAIPAHPALIAASSCGLSSDNALCTPDKLVPAATTRTDNQGAFPFKPVFTPIDRPVLQTSEGHVSVTSEERQKPLFTPSPCKAQTAPYEALFELALPKAAALFVARKTAEAAQRVGAKYPIEDDGKWHVSTSPLEVLDCLIQQGKDAHVRELNRLPLPSKSADWTHYGGSPPSDEIQTLRSQLLLLHNQLLYERYKREQHAVRNRRLLRRIINATALEEQNNAMKDQLKLQEDDIQSLKASLSEEQARNKKLREEHETMVSQLHTQIRQLQQGCDKYSTANQELQSKLMEYKKAAGDLRVELQKANNKICNTGHLLNQLRQKLTNSETVQQQMEFLNKQLLLLGEVNELYMEELRQSSPDNSKEEEMLKIAYEKENEKLRYNAIQQSQRLEAAQRRIVELETQFTKKEHLLMEQKKYLEDFKSQASHQLLAAQSRYITQKQITQVLEREMSELYSQLEKKNLLQSAGVVSDKRAGGRATEANTPMDSRSDCGGVSMSSVSNSDCTDVHQAESPKINKSTLSYRPPPSVSPGGGSSVNGRQDPPVLMEPSPSHSSSSSTSSATNDTPMTVGSYPSAKSFLTMRNRELFRNKSESQCDDEVPRLSSLSQVLKTEQCPDPLGTCAGDLDHCKTALGKEENTDGQQTKSYQEGTSQQRQQHLRIMDYNESHHDHS